MNKTNSFLARLKETARKSVVGHDTDGREQLIRLLDEAGNDPRYRPVLDSLCIRFGLYPYVSNSARDLTAGESISVELHRSKEKHFPLLHSEQAAVLNRLIDGHNVVLSAPTSFGKTKILESLLLEKQDWTTVIVIVPTIALMDELARRLSKSVPNYKIVTHSTQERGNKTLYLLTQERFLDIGVEQKIDFFMIDEFYQLSKETLDSRAVALNIAWRKLRESEAQFYLAGPAVKSLSNGVSYELRNSFYYSDFKTVAVDYIDRSSVQKENRLNDLVGLTKELDGPTLVFVSAVRRAVNVAIELGRVNNPNARSGLVHEFAAWLKENFTENWQVAEALSMGVGVHYGALPRGVQRLMVRLFDSGDLRILCCTSTLIEGVNTSARNIVIYDKEINRKRIDYFTFQNIVGRAGRMGKYYVGKVVTYMACPEPAELAVDVPIESQPEHAPDSLLVQVSASERKSSTEERLKQYLTNPCLPLWLIRKNSGYSPERQIEVAQMLIDDPGLLNSMQWSGVPTWEQQLNFFELILKLLGPEQRRGMSARKAGAMVGACRKNSLDLGSLIRDQVQYKRKDQGVSEMIDEILSFQRNWMGFKIGSAGAVLESIVSYLSADEEFISYSSFLTDIENLFLPTNLALLDEQGFPLPLIQKMIKLGLVGADGLDQTLERTYEFCKAHLDLDCFTDFEKWIIRDWMDVYAS